MSMSADRINPCYAGYPPQFWTRFIHLLISVFLKITGANYCQEYFPDFTTVEESVFTILNSKEGASNHMELLQKFSQLLNVVISIYSI
jgi:hypothetical protein